MNTIKYKLVRDEKFLGFIFITDNNPNIQDFRIGTIWVFSNVGNWEDGNLEFIGNCYLTDIFQINLNDSQIQQSLLLRTDVANFDNIVINQYE